MKVQLTAIPEQLKFRYPFRIAHGTRSGTDVVFVRAVCNGYVGFGEATLPPYLGVRTEDVLAFFSHPEVSGLVWPFHPVEIAAQLETAIPGVMPAKAALDMALWSLYTQMTKSDFREINNITKEFTPRHSYTIGVSDEEEMISKIRFAKNCGFDFFKLKFDGHHDLNMLEIFRKHTDDLFAVDVNQGWKNSKEAIQMSDVLRDAGCVLIEQPFPKEDRILSRQLMDHTSIPIIADESCQTIADLTSVCHSFDGINIKLQKCGGLSAAMQMLGHAKAMGLLVLIGCMSESSVGCNAAELLAPLSNWADLDGPWLLANNEALMMEIGYKKSL